MKVRHPDMGAVRHPVKSRTISVAAVVFGSLLYLSSASAQESTKAPAPGALDPQPNLWQTMLFKDIQASRQALDEYYIYSYTEDTRYRELADASMQEALTDARNVHDFSGYQAVLQRFAAEFHDTHLRLEFNVQLTQYHWPRFLVRYESGTYRVTASEVANVKVGSDVTACDGSPTQDVIDKTTVATGNLAGLESTAEAATSALFIDAGNPFVKRPVSCSIGGSDVKLDWRTISADGLAVAIAKSSSTSNERIAIDKFGRNSAWVRMPVFMTSTTEQAEQFRKIIAEAPSLRNKDAIVIDVRGNRGGQYNWFMAFLSQLYGADYTDYYAQARLKIRPVFVANPFPTIKGRLPEAAIVRAEQAQGLPPDFALDKLLSRAQLVEQPVAGGRKVYAAVVQADDASTPIAAPPSPVKAKVYVLTDARCWSACISFVDEVKKLPGVVQIGRETGVDSLSGTAESHSLVSGTGVIKIPTLVRVGRERADNVPNKPNVAYPGDISDTASIQKWVEKLNLSSSLVGS